MEIPKKLIEAIKNNKLVVFAGAGLSSKFNLPSWKKLVEEVIQEIGNEAYNAFLPLLNNELMAPVEVLEKLTSEHNIIRKYIKNSFRINNGDYSLHEKILRLTQKVITTNYDNAFEEASGNLIIPTIHTSKFNLSELNKTDEPYIFKIHGSYTESDHCIIFKDDYEKLYSSDTAAKEKLKNIFTDKTILFLGFSFNDPDINLIFNNLDNVFDNNNRHFILTKEPKSFGQYNFLEAISIKEYSEIDLLIEKCIEYKDINGLVDIIRTDNIKEKPKIALLFPNPLDINLADDFKAVIDCFDCLESDLFLGTLNIKTLGTLVDFDLIIIASKMYKSNLYIEDDNLKSNLLSASEICSNIPNNNIPVLFITNEKLGPIPDYPIISIASLRKPIIKRVPPSS